MASITGYTQTKADELLDAFAHLTGTVVDVSNILFVHAHAGHRYSVADAAESEPFARINQCQVSIA